MATLLFLEMPKGLKARKHVTSRIVTKEDVENVLLAIRQTYEEEEIDHHHYLSYRAIVLLGAFTGQRPQATIARLLVGQFRNAIGLEKPVLDILPEQDKIRMQHYCPLHPYVVEVMAPLLCELSDEELMFKQLSFGRWLKQQKVPLLHDSHHFVPGDLRKFSNKWGIYCSGISLTRTTYSHTGFREWIGDFISIRCLRTCMTCNEILERCAL